MTTVREAIKTGAQLVAGRTTGEMLKFEDDGKLTACAMGAVWLACHPDLAAAVVDLDADADLADLGLIDVETFTHLNTHIENWAAGRLGQLDPNEVGAIVDLNDTTPGDWDDVLAAIEEEEEGLLDKQVCTPKEPQ